MLRFALIGALMLGAHRAWLAHSKPRIELTGEWLDSLQRDYERRSGQWPDEAEKQALVKHQIEQEILYREAVKEGHVEDPRVKGLLAAILRESIEPVLGDPTDEELKEFRRQHGEAYQLPGQIAFEHVSFAAAAALPQGTLERLKAGEKVAGDPAVKLANPLPLTWLPQLRKLFGEDFVEQLESSPSGEWVGPLHSARGVHFVKVTQRHEAREMDFEEVKPALTSQWLKATKDAAVSARVDEWKKNYQIVLPEDVSGR